MLKKILITPLIILSFLQFSFGCTWFSFENDKGHYFIGRTMEWPGDLNTKITLVPRGYKFGNFTTHYGFVGMSHNGNFSDGMNEYGLAVSALWLSSSKYPDKKDADYNITMLLPYVLGNTTTVAQAVEFIKKHKFYTSVLPEISDKVEITVHFAISDAQGNSVVVEFINGKTKIYDNKIKVLTNDPAYDEQLKLLKKYQEDKFKEDKFIAFDYSSEGRFAKMAAFNITKANTPDDLTAVNHAWSIINTVDIPQGSLYWRWVSSKPQFTSYSVVGDLSNRVYYFRTWDNYDIRKVDLSKIDFAKAKYQADTIFGQADYQEFKFK
ncbi:choloylglycine hydrolase family protein [Francisella tularensis subsp. novicida GA99-3548]|uniref:linear amide C-N hydrolase n=1 Tax=Francisella tularensis TaxID=263 RepID=UPI000158B3C4|nr:linear amide C-N hydrolase [Francisella tularensis]AJI72868.1 linear amide C-N hydrolase, choloylglycine hydrolase family protein [Francisella tularensis subsp. novicida D9876]EDN37555.1 choloylglycine hydrolase family protein [Francisella tularensis subsp. novicida GA99-3548]